MFEYIKGTVEYISSDYIVLENNGMGFKITTSANCIKNTELHCKTTIYTYMNVREDDISLFGFNSRDELNCFKMLINVNSVGPKGALAILSALSLDELRLAVVSDDYKAISKANGIGTKTAQKIVLELKDKFKLEDLSFMSSDADEDTPALNSDNVTDTIEALTGLGYSNIEALRAVKNVKNYKELSTQALLKEALKKIY